jgi:hypothetical protein
MFEVLGSPKKHVEESLRKYLSTIKSDPAILVVKEEYAAAVEEKGLWSTFCEAEFLVLGLDKLTWLCIEFTPASVEILAPEELAYRSKDLTHWTNDLLAKLHEIGMITKGLNQKNKTLEMNMSTIVKNCILALCEKERTAKDITHALGIPEENLLQFLNALEGDGKISKKGKTYLRSVQHAKK